MWKLSSQGTWGHYWFGQFHSNLSVHPDSNTPEAFPQQSFCPNIHKCFGTSVRAPGTLDQKGKFLLSRLTPTEFNQTEVWEWGGVGVGEGCWENQQTPRQVSQAKPGTTVPLQGFSLLPGWVAKHRIWSRMGK